jgi:hypothetical protein
MRSAAGPLPASLRTARSRRDARARSSFEVGISWMLTQGTGSHFGVFGHIHSGLDGLVRFRQEGRRFPAVLTALLASERVEPLPVPVLPSNIRYLRLILVAHGGCKRWGFHAAPWAHNRGSDRAWLRGRPVTVGADGFVSVAVGRTVQPCDSERHQGR